ncbi:MAG: aldolase [Granulosicoccus sp.]|nr:aldolase [Granulosicoccus sp.]
MANRYQTERTQLAAAFRLAEKFGFHEGICNHFSVRLDAESEHYLINPYGVHWSQIQADTLLLIDAEGAVLEGRGEVEDTARFIHVEGHRANPRHSVLLHTHMPYATCLTMLDGDACELPMSHQTAARFYGRVAYVREFAGLALDATEGKRLAEAAKSAPDIDISFLTNHGVVVGGSSVAVAFDDLYYLERACRQHVLALQTGKPLKLIPDAVVRQTYEQFVQTQSEAAQAHFLALCQVMTDHPQHQFTF